VQLSKEEVDQARDRFNGREWADNIEVIQRGRIRLAARNEQPDAAL